MGHCPMVSIMLNWIVFLPPLQHENVCAATTVNDLDEAAGNDA